MLHVQRLLYKTYKMVNLRKTLGSFLHVCLVYQVYIQCVRHVSDYYCVYLIVIH